RPQPEGITPAERRAGFSDARSRCYGGRYACRVRSGGGVRAGTARAEHPALSILRGAPWRVVRVARRPAALVLLSVQRRRLWAGRRAVADDLSTAGTRR